MMNLSHVDGLSDPLGWLTHCDFFFRHHQTPDPEKIGIASFHLEGDAQLWFLKLERDNQSLTWEVKEECNIRFGPVLRCTRLGELLRQTGSVEEYQRKFVQLLARADSLTKDQEVEFFIAGLQEHIAVEILIHMPSTLTKVMHLARLYDTRTGATRSTHPGVGRRPTNTTLTGPYIRRLSRVEMEERRAKGLCYNCDELYTQGHKRKKLFLIEGVEDCMEDTVQETLEDDPEISIHAIAGTHGAQTMQIKGSLSRQSI